MKKLFILCFSLSAILLFSNFTETDELDSEDIKISGQVIDATYKEPLIGASIVVKGTSLGTVTDVEGYFELNIPYQKELILVCSYTGFTNKEKEVKVKEESEIRVDFSLEESSASLDEVVVIGYSSSRKSHSTSASVSRVTAESMRSVRKGKAKKAGKTKRTGKKMKMDAFKGHSVMPMAFDAVEEKEVRATSSSSISAGTLTAGEVHDFSKWDLWNDISEEDLNEWKLHWNLNLTERYTIQVINEDGFPVVDASVSLMNGKEVLWISKTDNTGKAELWDQVFEERKEKKRNLTAKVIFNGNEYFLLKLTKFQEGINFLKIQESCELPNVLDVLFVVDATSSMADEMHYLQAELYDVIERVKTMRSDMTINLGSVFYKDTTDDYLTRKDDLTTNISKAVDFLKAQSTSGGGDYPEAVDAALEVAMNEISWSENAVAKLLFLVLDAPPHHNPAVMEKLNKLILKAAEKGVRIIPIASSGVDKSTEYLLRSFALATNGTYVFLTDHSGIGNPHIEATTDEYEVEKLNDLLIRVIKQFTEVTDCENPEDLTNLFKDENQSDKEDQNEIKIFPNPTSGQFKVNLKKSVQELFVTDLGGKVLIRLENVKKGDTPINIEQFPSGIYFVRFMEKDKMISERVLLQRD